MDASAFDRLSRAFWLAANRRTTLGALLAAGGMVLPRVEQRANAQPSCQPNGTRCSDGAECCSGRCKQRHRDTHGTCRQADHQGVCTIEENACGPLGSHFCSTTSSCLCYVTATGRSFCGEPTLVQPGDCGCASNRQCEQRLGKGAKCLRGELNCCPNGENHCLRPCLNPDPVP